MFSGMVGNKQWSPQQEQALKACSRWMRDPRAKQVFYLAGFAGTGKTTLAKHFVENEGHWLFAAYTGKAAHVLRQKGCSDASTIHSLIYRPAGETKEDAIDAVSFKIAELEKAGDSAELRRLRQLLEHLLDVNQPVFNLWYDSPLNAEHITGVVIDEVSMVNKDLGQDLESFGKRILVLGDPEQLPPVGGAGYFVQRTPDVMLTEVHRQARESGILQLATDVRTGVSWRHKSYNDVDIVDDIDDFEALRVDQVLVGTNVVRHSINDHFRCLLKFTQAGPQPGERLVCLRNNRTNGLYNGSQWKVVKASNNYEANVASLSIVSEDTGSRMWVNAWLHHFLGTEDKLKRLSWVSRSAYDEFDWSYALTVHKAQGSQWDHVLVLDQSAVFLRSPHRWLYTAVTRAAKKLTLARR